jgi:protein-disulfide isomerase
MSRASRRHSQRIASPKKGFNWKLWGTLFVLAAIIVAAVVFTGNKGTGVDYTQYTALDAQFENAGATKTLEEFSDFQCPACQATSPSIKALRDSAPDDVVVRYRHFPLRSIHPLAQGAAVAAECAREQGRFWAYHDVLMDSKKLTSSDLKLHAEGLGLDVNAWEACVDDGEAAALVERDYQEGTARGVRGTPTIFVNGEVYQGARTPTAYLAALNS